MPERLHHIISQAKTSAQVTLAQVPSGFDAFLLADMAKLHFGSEGQGQKIWVHICRNDASMRAIEDSLKVFAPDIEPIIFPDWDCLPYDRTSPSTNLLATRLFSLYQLASSQLDKKKPLLVLTTINAVLQKTLGPQIILDLVWHAKPGETIEPNKLIRTLTENGFVRVSSVAEPGDFAQRGGLIDIFPPGHKEPVRIDLFGDVIDSLRSFDPHTQMTTGQLKELTIMPASEVQLTEHAIIHFRKNYSKLFGSSIGQSDPLYEAISQGHKYNSMEHWLPLFHKNMSTIFAYFKGAKISLDHLVEDALEERLSLIDDFYQARMADMDKDSEANIFSTTAYKPLPPEYLYLSSKDYHELLDHHHCFSFSPFLKNVEDEIDLGARKARNFAPERGDKSINIFESLNTHIRSQQKTKTIIACWSKGSLMRMETVLNDYLNGALVVCDTWQDALKIKPGQVALIILALESGFKTDQFEIISEQDILGERLRRKSRAKKASDVLTEATALTPGDLVVHSDHGIGRFEGLKSITVQNAPHDCLHLSYAGGDRLFLPIENIELLTRYGSDFAESALDRLGGAGWQTRKAKLKARVKDMAEKIIALAASRQLQSGDILQSDVNEYQEFCARFPYEETEDQMNAITDVATDLASGRPMDRLVCGDVGFGKTEVALRAAYIAAMSGKQVAIIVPTTLLCRQHFASFSARFKGFPLRVAQASRLVSAKELKQVKEGLLLGEIDIIIGTHILLGKNIEFHDLGLIIIDEEQRFGVAHKEKLKNIRARAHVLTLTATPIPRTLQLAFSGARELSLMATPPVDRLAVRTFVSPFDPIIVRQTLLRELYRGGQSFYVAPRISDLQEIATYLREEVPEVTFAIAHGQMESSVLDETMTAFYDGKYNVLLSTSIIESGLDIPTANTLIVHRADMFGMAQLYQLRGRVGRSKQRGYALLTYNQAKPLTTQAEKRLSVLQSLDTLGAGFTLASHDMDIRGSGNLLGEEQSGHIKEVGYELYQSMLEEAVSSLKSGGEKVVIEDKWSPQINLGTAVLIPETYVPDLGLRLNLYRRLSVIEDKEDISAFKVELIDRFGDLPIEVEHLLKIVEIKTSCRIACVESIDSGPRGAVLSFRNNHFPNPEGLIDYISKPQNQAKMKADHKLVLIRSWASAEDRLTGTALILEKLKQIAQNV